MKALIAARMKNKDTTLDLVSCYNDDRPHEHAENISKTEDKLDPSTEIMINSGNPSIELILFQKSFWQSKDIKKQATSIPRTFQTMSYENIYKSSWTSNEWKWGIWRTDLAIATPR